MSMLLILPIPLSKLLGWLGWIIWAVFALVTMFYAICLEKHKNKHNIQTYKEVVAFIEGTSLTQIEQAKEEGKRPYQKVLLIVGFALLPVVVIACMSLIYKLL